MGLDTVQIIVDVEDCFGIELPDNEVAKISTVGELSEFVYLMVKGQETHSCLNQILFFRLRKYFAKRLPAPSEKFSPPTKISRLVSKSELPFLIDDLEQFLNLDIPKIKKSLLVNFDDVRYSGTVQDLVDKIIVQNMNQLSSQHGISKATVVDVVKAIIYNISGLDRDKIVPGAVIAYDLGID